MLPLTKPVGSAFRLRYQGEVGVAGIGVQQFWDLSELPEVVRTSKYFKESLLVFVQQIDMGVSAVASDVLFVPPIGPPLSFALTLTAAADTDQLGIDVWYLHSIEGLAAGSQAYFVIRPGASALPTPHAVTHENGGTDEINVAGLSGLLADPQTPLGHAASHENGGGDEINVAGLSGLLADPQTPLGHAASHENGGGDEINVAGLSGLLADPQTPLGHAASHENGGGDEINVAGLSGLLADPQTPLAHAASHAPTGSDPLSAPTLILGNNSVSGTTATRYMTPGYDSSLAPLTAIQYRVAAPCTFRNMRVRHNVPLGNGAAIVYTLRNNNVATALAVSIASTAADASNLVDTAVFAAGDLLDIEVTKAASVGTSPSDIMITIQVGPP